jgi:2-hydroxy-3-keto-5-methylthiopentenyl-1-phosphate phosphatase
MLPVRSVLVDFDGTACAHDVAVDVLERFGDPVWLELDEACERGEIGNRECISRQAALLTAPVDEMVAYAVEHCPLDPAFASFVGWARDGGADVTIVSDGFGFYVGPVLEAGGVDGVGVVTNTFTSGGAIAYGSGHTSCVGCGTCKMRAVLEARERGPVAFVGDGWSDRFAALYTDVLFAKRSLVAFAQADAVPFVPWDTFADVRSWLETHDELPGAVDPATCPGWLLPA